MTDQQSTMLTELDELQKTDERVWGVADVSFSIRTRSEDGQEAVKRTYTFSHAPEWEKWMFTDYEEMRAPSTEFSEANWRREKSLTWDEEESRTVDIPKEVNDKLSELLGLEEMIIQRP